MDGRAARAARELRFPGGRSVTGRPGSEDPQRRRVGPQPAAVRPATSPGGRARCRTHPDRDVELGVAPHTVLGDVEAGLLDLGLRPDPDRHLQQHSIRNETVNVNAPTAASPSACTPSWWSPPP